MLGRPIMAILPWIVLVVGILAMILGLGAGYFQLDANQKWGPIRTIIFIFGISLTGGSLGHLVISALDLFLLAQNDTNFFTNR